MLLSFSTGLNCSQLNEKALTSHTISQNSNTSRMLDANKCCVS